MNLRTLFLYFFLLCLSISEPCSAFLEKDVHLLNMQNGLADNTISAIYKDKEGFIWFGTRSGISRYDGKQITNFELKDTYPDISDIREVFGGILTVVSHERLYAFDLVRERFIPVVSAEGTGVEAEAVMMENDSLLWVISGKELRTMRRNRQTVRH